MRLRQAVDHPYLIIHGLKKEGDEAEGGEKLMLPSRSNKKEGLGVCALCQEEILKTRELVIAGCGHAFHKEC